MGHVVVVPGQERRIYVQVNGHPASQGSKDAVPYRKADGKLGVRVKNRATQEAKIRNWRADVKGAVAGVLAVHGDGWAGPIEGPVQVVVTFTMPQVALPRRVRWGDRLVEAVHHPFRQPDIDKLLRATFDALTAAGVWLDDAQVVDVRAAKTYPGLGSHALPAPGAMILVRQLPTVRVPAAPAGAALPADPVHEAAATAALF